MFKFECKDCNYNKKIIIDEKNEIEVKELFEWLKVHCAEGGRYTRILPTRIECAECKGKGHKLIY